MSKKNKIMSSTETTAGGWIPCHPITPANQKVFTEAMAPSGVIWEAIAEIFQQLQGILDGISTLR